MAFVVSNPTWSFTHNGFFFSLPQSLIQENFLSGPIPFDDRVDNANNFTPKYITSLTPEQEIVFRRFVHQAYALDDETWEAFAAAWTFFEAKRKTILTTSGEVEKYVYFVLEGVQRAYYVGENDKEATIVFTYAPSFSGVADSALTGLPSKYYFETLTASSFLRIRTDILNELMEKYRPIQNMIFRMASLSLYGVLARQAEIQSFSSEEKFRTLLNRSPHLLQLVPHKYIASYLGIDATNFSKLLGSVKL